MYNDKIKRMKREQHNKLVDANVTKCLHALPTKPFILRPMRSRQDGSKDTPLTNHRAALGYHAKRAAKPTLPKMPWETT